MKKKSEHTVVTVSSELSSGGETETLSPEVENKQILVKSEKPGLVGAAAKAVEPMDIDAINRVGAGAEESTAEVDSTSDDALQKEGEFYGPREPEFKQALEAVDPSVRKQMADLLRAEFKFCQVI